MFLLINTLDLSVSSQPDGWSSSPIVVGIWVERLWNWESNSSVVGTRGCLTVFSFVVLILNRSHRWWTLVVTVQPTSWGPSKLAHLSCLSACPLPPQTPFSSRGWCCLLTAHTCFLVACVSGLGLESTWPRVLCTATSPHCPLVEGADRWHSHEWWARVSPPPFHFHCAEGQSIVPGALSSEADGHQWEWEGVIDAGPAPCSEGLLPKQVLPAVSASHCWNLGARHVLLSPSWCILLPAALQSSGARWSQRKWCSLLPGPECREQEFFVPLLNQESLRQFPSWYTLATGAAHSVLRPDWLWTAFASLFPPSSLSCQWACRCLSGWASFRLFYGHMYNTLEQSMTTYSHVITVVDLI